MVKCEYITAEMLIESQKPINYIPNLLLRKAKDNQHTCIGFGKWENVVKYVDLYFDLVDEKYKNMDRIIHCTDCKLDYNSFNKLYELFKEYIETDNYDKGYFSVIPPTDIKQVKKLNNKIKKALG